MATPGNEVCDPRESFQRVLDFEILESSEKSGLTKIEVSSESKEKSEYVPYTNKALNWHTDGYYSENDNPIFPQPAQALSNEPCNLILISIVISLSGTIVE